MAQRGEGAARMTQGAYPIGFVTIARGPWHYTELAVDMALSLRQFHDLPLILLADTASQARVAQLYPDIFTQVVALPQDANLGRVCKFRVAELAPLERGIFIDADIIILRDLDRELAQCGTAPIHMMGRFVDAQSGHRHHGVRVEKLCKLFNTDRFFTSHSGAFLYDRVGAQPLLAQAERVYGQLYNMRPPVGPLLGDELAFGIAAAQVGIAQMQDPYPVVWSGDFSSFDITNPRKAMLHFHTAPPAAVLAHVLAQIAARRVAAGLDPAIGVKAWKRKALRNRLDIMVIAKRLARQWRRFRQRMAGDR